MPKKNYVPIAGRALYNTMVLELERSLPDRPGRLLSYNNISVRIAKSSFISAISQPLVCSL